MHGARFLASHSRSQGFNWLRRQLLKAPRVWEPGDGSADGCSAPGDSLPGGGASVRFCRIISHPQCAGFPGGAVGKNPPANAGNARDADSIPGSGRSPRGGKGGPLQYSCLENPTDRGAWQAIVQGVPESHTQLRLSSRACLTPKDTQWVFSANALFLAVLCVGSTVESDILQEPHPHVWPSVVRLGWGARPLPQRDAHFPPQLAWGSRRGKCSPASSEAVPAGGPWANVGHRPAHTQGPGRRGAGTQVAG